MAQRIVGEFILGGHPVAATHFSPVFKIEYGLDATGYIVGEQTDSAGRGDRGEVAVAQTLVDDAFADICRKALDERLTQTGIGVEKREAALFGRQCDGGPVRSMADRLHRLCSQPPRLI